MNSPTQLPPRPGIEAMRSPTPTSIESMNYWRQTYEGDKRTDPKQQDLHDKGHQDITYISNAGHLLQVLFKYVFFACPSLLLCFYVTI